MFSLGSSIYYIYEDNPPDYVDMGRSNEMQSNYAPVKVAKVVGVLPAHYPVICWVITESRGVRLCLSVTTLQVINELKTTRAFLLTPWLLHWRSDVNKSQKVANNQEDKK